MHNLKELLEGYLNDRLTPDQLDEFLELMDREDTAFPDRIQEMLEAPRPAGRDIMLRDRLYSELMGRVAEATAEPPPLTAVPVDHAGPSSRRISRRWMAAAAVLLLIGAAAWFLWPPQKGSMVQHTAGHEGVTDVAPGTQGAVLTLADGTTVALDNKANGVVADQQGTRIHLKDGLLAYDAGKATEVVYNTITTPRGRQFRIELPDGSAVWLNAASSLKYPTSFQGKERVVEVKGEAYFEIAPALIAGTHTRKPFTVKVNDEATIEVLGTHFNVNAYDDEPVMATTLLEGRIDLLAGRTGTQQQVALQPGQQAVLAPQASGKATLQVLNKVNVHKVMAWKNGLFYFDNDDLRTMMRQLARWYDVEVVFEAGAPVQEVFTGEIQRNLKLSQLLHILENMRVAYRIEGRKIIVTP